MQGIEGRVTLWERLRGKATCEICRSGADLAGGLGGCGLLWASLLELCQAFTLQ